MSRRPGFSLVEVMLAMALLSMVILGIFGVFDLGQSAFRLMASRQDLQSQARTALFPIERDTLQTALTTVTLDDRAERSAVVEGTSFPRHAICMAGLDRWSDPTNFEALSGLPRWNRYLVYFATRQAGGFLVRWQVRPEAGASGTWSDFSQGLPDDLAMPTLPAGYELERQQTLAVNVLEFRVEPQEQTLIYHLKLRRRAGERLGGARPRDESFQLRLEATPNNG